MLFCRTHNFNVIYTLINFRVKDLSSIGQPEKNLLYTLHWIFLFAAAECADIEENAQKNKSHSSNEHIDKVQKKFLFSVPTISVSYFQLNIII